MSLILKRIILTDKQKSSSVDQSWLNLGTLAEVEITSEDAIHPIESALLPGWDNGWRASCPGKQTIRVLFENPQRLRRIRLNFIEINIERTQEFTLRWSSDGGQSFQEIVRQQWNFSPEGATSEMEDLQVDLQGVAILELAITPDINSGNAIASLEQLLLA